MSDSLNNKELVAVGHQFAKAMSSDTPIMDIAKIVSRLAERLDCTTVALREMTKQRDALAKAWDAQDDHINQHAERIESLENTNAGLGKALGAAQKRIADLEAQTASQLPLPVQVSVDFALIRRALANAGAAAPESDEELRSSHIRQILKFVAEQATPLLP